MELTEIERKITASNDQVRLRALKLLFRHPDATPLQLARALCARLDGLEQFRVYDLDAAVRTAWKRLRYCSDDAVYEYLARHHSENPEANVSSVFGVLEQLGTPRALQMVMDILPSLPEQKRRQAEVWTIPNMRFWMSRR